MFVIIKSLDGKHETFGRYNTRKLAEEQLEGDSGYLEVVSVKYESEILTDKAFYKKYPNYIRYVSMRKIHPLIKERIKEIRSHL